MAGHFVLRKSSDKFSFILKSGNGETILTSQRYASKSSASNGIASVQRNAPTDTLFERKSSKSGQPFFTLKSGNNQIIGQSQMYKSEKSRDNGIESVKKNGVSSDIRDET